MIFEGMTEFALIFVIIYLASLLVLFSVGFTVNKLNNQHPERKIQKRESSSRPIEDIRSSMLQLMITSTCLSIGLYSQNQGWTLVDPVDLNWWTLPVFFVISLVLHDTWFYWGHRILHTKFFYCFHSPHHRNVTPTVWSNDSGHSVDTLFAHTYYAVVVFFIPIPAAVLLLHRLFDQVSAAIGHCGYEHFAGVTARKPWPLLCTIFHDQHHQYFLYNYANYFSIWDRICGTVHPKYDNTVKKFEAVYNDSSTSTNNA
jgi:sterol desaturase/sphingolipid hydroxylase (fatty acid hydroxylase superfamily)